MSTLTTRTCASAAAVACDTVTDSAAVTAAAIAAVVMPLVVSVCDSHQVAPLTINFVCNGVDSLTRDLGPKSH